MLSEPPTEPSSCPACRDALAPWRSVPSAEPILAPGRFSLWRCRACGTAVTAGALPAELHDRGAYRPGEPRLHRAVRPLLHAFDAQRLSLLGELVTPPARLLDVGAGRGRFVSAAAAAGYEAAGIDPSERGVAAAVAIDAHVARAGVEQAQIADRSLDAVTLWHVLEHLDDPGAAIARIAGWLKPGGALLVGVPNLASLQARLGGAAWYHLDVPRHRVHFTPTGLSALLRAHGLEPVRTEHVLLEHNPYGFWQTLLNRVTAHPSYLYNLLKRNAPLRSSDLALTLAALPLAPAAVLAEWIAGRIGLGGTIAMLASRGGYH